MAAFFYCFLPNASVKKTNSTTFAVFAIAILSLLMSGCQSPSEQTTAPYESTSKLTTTSDSPHVLSTVGMIGDLVKQIGDNRIRSSTLMGSGVDPHLYKPTRDDVVRLRQASLLFFNGLHLEGKMGTVFQRLQSIGGSSQRHIAIAPHAIKIATDVSNAKTDLEFEGDPHVWMDIEIWSYAPEHIATSLAELAPEHANELNERASALSRQLKRLNEYGKQVIATIPEQSRVLITSHDAFQYFGRRYGLQVEGIQGISTDSEAGLQRVRMLVDRIVDRKIPAIFIESSVSPQMITALVKGAEAQGAKVAMAGPLYSDALGPSGTYEGTYIGMMEHNLNTVATWLGGKIPEGGFRTWSETQVQP